MKYDASKVTPRPWAVQAEGDHYEDGEVATEPGIYSDSGGARWYIATICHDAYKCIDGSENAHHIVHCVNTHEALVDIARRVAEHFDGTDAPLGIDARAALALAMGEQ